MTEPSSCSTRENAAKVFRPQMGHGPVTADWSGASRIGMFMRNLYPDSAVKYGGTEKNH
jgi:hypothetical protein